MYSLWREDQHVNRLFAEEKKKTHMKSVKDKFWGPHGHKGEAVISPAWGVGRLLEEKLPNKEDSGKQEVWRIRNKMLNIFDYVLCAKYCAEIT